jgi:hypothetical protein
MNLFHSVETEEFFQREKNCIEMNSNQIGKQGHSCSTSAFTLPLDQWHLVFKTM